MAVSGGTRREDLHDLVDAHRRHRNHDLRHTAVPLMLEERVPVNLVSRVLGRSDTTMPLRRYAHALPDMREMAADAMEEYAF